MNFDTFNVNLTSVFGYLRAIDCLPFNCSGLFDHISLFVDDIFGRAVSNWESPLKFEELQLWLFHILLAILVISITLNVIYWYKYSDDIVYQFTRQSTAEEIEELRLSVEKLKLPKEHTPRI